jgi:hypothetical protein
MVTDQAKKAQSPPLSSSTTLGFLASNYANFPDSRLTAKRARREFIDFMLLSCEASKPQRPTALCESQSPLNRIVSFNAMIVIVHNIQKIYATYTPVLASHEAQALGQVGGETKARAWFRLRA